MYDVFAIILYFICLLGYAQIKKVSLKAREEIA